MDRSLGHPARWLDVAAAVVECEEEWWVRVRWEVEVVLVLGEEPKLLLWCTVSPSVWSPHGGKDPIVRHRTFGLGRDRPVSESMYALLWAVMQTVYLVWPIREPRKGPAQPPASAEN